MQDERLGAATVSTNAICNPTGLSLIAGRNYRIRLEMTDDWFDKDVRTDVGGFAVADVVPPEENWFDAARMKRYLLLLIAAPLKRWWQENWFQPIARIGERGNYEHVLKPAAPLPAAAYGSCRPPEEAAASLRGAIDDVQTPAKARSKCELGYRNRASRLLISDVAANASGELFIYVNDAVLALPGLGDLFYRNNRGTAKVSVTRIVAPQVIDSQ
jgi:hypothetical protein